MSHIEVPYIKVRIRLQVWSSSSNLTWPLWVVGGVLASSKTNYAIGMSMQVRGDYGNSATYDKAKILDCFNETPYRQLLDDLSIQRGAVFEEDIDLTAVAIINTLSYKIQIFRLDDQEDFEITPDIADWLDQHPTDIAVANSYTVNLDEKYPRASHVSAS